MRFGEAHFPADLILRLLIEVETGKDLAIAMGHAVEDLLHQVGVLAQDGVLLGAGGGGGKRGSCFDIEAGAAALDGVVDMGGDLAPDNGTDEAHEAGGVPQIAAAQGLYDDEEGVVDLILEFLGAELAAKVEADAAREDTIEVLHAGSVAGLNALDEFVEVDLAGSGRGIRRGVIRRILGVLS